MSKNIYGMHDPGDWTQIIRDAGREAWCVFTVEVGHNPDETHGQDFSVQTGPNITPIVRINNGYAGAGTIPTPDQYENFAKRCANFVAASYGCNRWIIGNEIAMNWEWPNNQPITLADYVRCFKLVRDAIKAVQPDAIVCPQAPAPWNNQLVYPGNPLGDWVQQLSDMLVMIGDGQVDGIALHTYTHGHNPSLITSEATMNQPFDRKHYHFRAYQDFMNVIPYYMRDLPVYITESNPDGWQDVNNGWIQAAYQEIENWNRGDNQQIRCLAFYRWPQYDNEKFWISTKHEVIADFKTALVQDYRWRPDKPVKQPEFTLFTPVEGVITQKFGERPEYYSQIPGYSVPLKGHNGLDIGCVVGTPVFACDAGFVVDARWDDWGFGNIVKLQHVWGQSLYAHLSGSVVTPGQSVGRGTYIAQSGDTGNSDGPHLHFGIKVNPWLPTDGWGGYSDPLLYLPQLASPQTFGPGVEVETTDVVRLRGTPAGFTISPLVAGQRIRIVGFSQTANGLIWWPVETSKGIGWVAQADANGVPLIKLPEAAAGDPVETLAKKYSIDAKVIKAVIAIESNGQGFVNGRLVIRFEPHIFFGYLPEPEQRQFWTHFQVGDPTWDGNQHKVSLNADGNYQSFHGNQDLEWQALKLAITINEDAAYNSASYGIGQIMGFNHATCGYRTAQAMFEDFKTGEGSQIEAMFAFIKHNGGIQDLRNGDYFSFAKKYNGPANAAYYSSLIQARL